QIVFRRWIRSLHLIVEAALEFNALAAQPLQIGIALFAEATQCCIADHTFGFHFQIVVHVLWRVVITRLALKPGTAATVIDAAADRRRAAAFKTIDNQNVGAVFFRFQCRAGASRAKADHDHIGGVGPHGAVGIIEYQRCFDARMPHRIARLNSFFIHVRIPLRYSPYRYWCRTLWKCETWTSCTGFVRKPLSFRPSECIPRCTNPMLRRSCTNNRGILSTCCLQSEKNSRCNGGTSCGAMRRIDHMSKMHDSVSLPLGRERNTRQPSKANTSTRFGKTFQSTPASMTCSMVRIGHCTPSFAAASIMKPIAAMVTSIAGVPAGNSVSTRCAASTERTVTWPLPSASPTHSLKTLRTPAMPARKSSGTGLPVRCDGAPMGRSSR